MSSDSQSISCRGGGEFRKKGSSTKLQSRSCESLERRHTKPASTSGRTSRDDQVLSSPPNERNSSFLTRVRAMLHIGNRSNKNAKSLSKENTDDSGCCKRLSRIPPLAKSSSTEAVSPGISTATFEYAKDAQRRYSPSLGTISESKINDCVRNETEEMVAIKDPSQAQTPRESSSEGCDSFARSHFMRLTGVEMEHVVEMKTGSSKENPDNAMAEKGAATAVESECAKPVMKNLDTSAVLLPEQKDVHKGLKTLVLDLDETLVHSGFDMIDKPDYVVQIDVSGVQRTLYVKKRPGCDRFLHEMADCFEIIVFTASLPKYADTVCDLLNQSVGRDVIAHRLFRDSCEFDVDALCFVKNLHKLGRDIKNIVIVDNSPSAYLKNVENAIPVVSWFSDETDHTLEDLIPPLREIANAEDARVAIYKSSVLQRLRETLTDNTWDSVGQT